MERGRGADASRCAKAADPEGAGGERGQRGSIYRCRRRWGRAGESGLERKGGGLNEGWLRGGYSQVQGVGRPSEGRDGRRELTCTDLRLEPILQPGDQRGQDVHAQENHLQRQTVGSRQRPIGGLAPSPAGCRRGPESLAQTRPGSPSERRPEGEAGYQEEGRSCPKGRLTELIRESLQRDATQTQTPRAASGRQPRRAGTPAEAPPRQGARMQISSRPARGLLGTTERPLCDLPSLRKRSVGGELQKP